jgi:hypothetical protein
VEEIELKGSLDNFNTRLGEGFHQEIQEYYKGTNGKNAERQVISPSNNSIAIDN